MACARLFIAVLASLTSISAVLADAAPVDMASDTACRLDRVREIITGAEKSSASTGEANQLILENTADWLPDYNAFATSIEATDLSAAINGLAGKPSRAACRQLLPFAAVAASAAKISQAGGEVTPGAVLIQCEDGDDLCVPPATQRIIDQCRVALFSLPLRSTC